MEPRGNVERGGQSTVVPLIKGKGVFKKNEWFEMEMERVDRKSVV